MAITLVQQATGSAHGSIPGGGSTTFTVTLTSPTNAGNTLIVVVGSYGNNGTASQVSATGVTFTRLGLAFYSSDKDQVEIWAAANIPGGVTKISVTVASGATSAGANVSEWSGLATTLSQDGTGVASTGSNQTPSTGVLATANATDLLIAATTDDYYALPSTPSGWTALNTIDLSTIAILSDYQVTTATGTFSATWSGDRGSYGWAALIVGLNATTVQTYTQTLTAASSASAGMARTAGLFRTVTSPSAPLVVKNVSLVRGLASPSVATAIKRIPKILSASSWATATLVYGLVKQMVLAASSAASVALAWTRTWAVALSAASSSVASRIARVSKIFSLSSAASVSRILSVSKILSAVSPSGASAIRTLGRVLFVRTASLVALARNTGKAFGTLSSSSVLMRKATIKTLSTAVSSSVSMLRAQYRMLAAFVSSSASLTRSLGHLLVVRVVSVPIVIRSIVLATPMTAISRAAASVRAILGFAPAPPPVEQWIVEGRHRVRRRR
jgi:hypothetical protein